MRQLLQGNSAIALGAIKAGLGFFAGYPITPSSEILHELIGKVKVMQMEDEIASINACIGASLAGLKAMTATSGPGFSLMQETIGFGHMAEVPIVVVNSQRVGPSTGMPTMPAQGDIMQSCYGSHGDYFPLVFYPNSISELYRFTIYAFNAAEESLSPVILLSDAFLSRLYETVELEEYPVVERKRKPLGLERRHFTGLTHEGNFPRTTDPQIHENLIRHMKGKQKDVASRYNYYEYIENRKAKCLLVAYGADSRAVYYFRDKYSIFRPIRLFPPIEELNEIAKNYSDIVVVEMNCGQYAGVVERICRREVKVVSILGGRMELKWLREKLNEL